MSKTQICKTWRSIRMLSVVIWIVAAGSAPAFAQYDPVRAPPAPPLPSISIPDTSSPTPDLGGQSAIDTSKYSVDQPSGAQAHPAPQGAQAEPAGKN
jgi:hypothetical protein